MNGARVLLCRLSVRTSSRGNQYLAGFLGAARLVGFKAREPDKYGNEVWELYAQEPEPKPAETPPQAERPPLPVRGQRTWDRARQAARQPAPLPPEAAPFYDDSEQAIADLTVGQEPRR